MDAHVWSLHSTGWMFVSAMGTCWSKDRTHSGRRACADLQFSMSPDENGIYRAYVDGAGPGTRYWFKIDGAGPFPDPASRFQPLGVHGPSQVVEPNSFPWKVSSYQAPSLQDLVIYELHVGTFTPAGTFLALIDKLDYLRQLGINAIELMPIADFAGEYNWGYDGVSLYAPAHSYGTPDDLRRLIDEAHRPRNRCLSRRGLQPSGAGWSVPIGLCPAVLYAET